MHESDVCWIDQADYGVVNICRHRYLFHKEKLFVERRHEVGKAFFSPLELRFILRNINPYRSADLFARIFKDLYFLRIKFLIGQRGNTLACAGMVKFPSVIATLKNLSIIPPLRKRYPPMGAVVF